MFFFRKVLFVQIRILKVSGEGTRALKGTAYPRQTAWMPGRAEAFSSQAAFAKKQIQRDSS